MEVSARSGYPRRTTATSRLGIPLGDVSLARRGSMSSTFAEVKIAIENRGLDIQRCISKSFDWHGDDPDGTRRSCLQWISKRRGDTVQKAHRDPRDEGVRNRPRTPQAATGRFSPPSEGKRGNAPRIWSLSSPSWSLLSVRAAGRGCAQRNFGRTSDAVSGGLAGR